MATDVKSHIPAWLSIAVGLILGGAGGGGTTGRAQQTQPAMAPVEVRMAQSTEPSSSLSTAGTAANDGKGSFVAAPVPISSPAIGSGIIPVFGYFFQMNHADKVSPASVVGVMGLITDNGSRSFGMGADLYFKEDSYRARALYFQGNLNYNLYGLGLVAADQGDRIPLKQSGQVFFGEFLRAIYWRFFVGPRFITGNSLITVRDGSEGTVAPPSDVGLRTHLRA